MTIDQWCTRHGLGPTVVFTGPPRNDQDALRSVLGLAMTAPTDELAGERCAMAECLASSLPREDVQFAKQLAIDDVQSGRVHAPKRDGNA